MNASNILRIIHNLEIEIDGWKTFNSQSNPGAMMELRDNKKKLEKFKVLYEALIKSSIDNEKKETEKEKSNKSE